MHERLFLKALRHHRVDPLTAIGLVRNLLQFPEFRVQLFFNAKRIYPTGLSDDEKKLAVWRGENQTYRWRHTRREHGFVQIGVQLHSTASTCSEIENEILGILDRLRLDVEGKVSQKWNHNYRSAIVAFVITKG